MPLIKACCCWDTLEQGSRASAWFTGFTGVVNACIDIWILVKLHSLDNFLEDHEKINFFPPGIIVFCYFELFFNLGLIGLAFMLMIGINRAQEGYKLIHGWVWGFCLHRGYEVFLGVYILCWLGAHRISDVIFIIPEFITVIVWWFVNCILLIAAVICVMSYWSELMDEIYGKFRRIKYFSMISNLRNAALSSRTQPGTPRSAYARSMASTLHMAPSQMSMRSGNPYTHYGAPAPPQHPMAPHPHAYQGPYVQQHSYPLPPGMPEKPPMQQSLPPSQPHSRLPSQAGSIPPKY